MAIAIAFPSATHAATVYANTDRVKAEVSDDNGQLLDWSNTDKKIETIFLDNPERFRNSFVFVADGCNKNKCVNATAIAISARPQGKVRYATMKVRLIDSKGQRSIVVVNITKVPYNDDGTIVFAAPPELLPDRMSVTNQLFRSGK